AYVERKSGSPVAHVGTAVLGCPAGESPAVAGRIRNSTTGKTMRAHIRNLAFTRYSLLATDSSPAPPQTHRPSAIQSAWANSRLPTPAQIQTAPSPSPQQNPSPDGTHHWAGDNAFPRNRAPAPVPKPRCAPCTSSLR